MNNLINKLKEKTVKAKIKFHEKVGDYRVAAELSETHKYPANAIKYKLMENARNLKQFRRNDYSLLEEAAKLAISNGDIEKANHIMKWGFSDYKKVQIVEETLGKISAIDYALSIKAYYEANKISKEDNLDFQYIKICENKLKDSIEEKDGLKVWSDSMELIETYKKYGLIKNQFESARKWKSMLKSDYILRHEKNIKSHKKTANEIGVPYFDFAGCVIDGVNDEINEAIEMTSPKNNLEVYYRISDEEKWDQEKYWIEEPTKRFTQFEHYMKN